MPDLEQELADLASAIEWPPTPRLLSVYGEVGRAGPRSRAGILFTSRWALAAAAVVLIVATLLAYTPSREAIAGWINLHTNILRVEHPPTPSPRSSGPLGETLNLGSPTTLDQAQHEVSWKVGIPSVLGPPDQVYVKLPPSGPSQGAVSLVYARRSDIPVSGFTGVSVLVTEARGRVDERYFEKMVGAGVTIEEVSVNGHRGFWITGEPHDFFFTDASGQQYFDRLRLAANTLIFDNAGTIVRIEGEMTRAQALRIAASL